MNKTAQTILLSVLLTALGILAVVFPVFSDLVTAVVGFVGILYAVLLWTLYRTAFRTRRTMMLAASAVIVAALGVLLLLQRIFRFSGARWLVLAECVALGLITVAFGLQCKDRGLRLWVNVTVIGGAAVAAGVCAIFRIQAVITVACVTAAALLLRPLVVAALSSAKEEKKKKKVVTVREKDIEVIPDDDDATREEKP